MDYEDIPFSTSIYQGKLDIESHRRMNSLPWRGQFSPELVEALLNKYAAEEELVVDPFSGSGTTLIEASSSYRPSYGMEVNPSAYILARLYLLGNDPWETAISALQTIKEKIFVKHFDEDVSRDLLEIVGSSETYAERYLSEALFLLTLKNGEKATSKQLQSAQDMLEKLLFRLPTMKAPLSLELGDARSLSLADNTASTVLTSPPYVNVFNYHQNYRKAVEMLGWEVLPTARSEFGSNRKHRQNRFFTVTQYAQDIGQTLAETARVVKPGGISIWVVGRESNVRGAAIPNPRSVYEMAQGIGLTLVAKHERKFRSRYGALVYEDIVVFKHTDKGSFTNVDVIELGRHVGAEVLKRLAPKTEITEFEIKQAIEKSAMMIPSPYSVHSPSNNG